MRVVIADDTALLRQGIARLLTEAGVEVSGEADDATQLLDLIEAAARCRHCRHPHAPRPHRRGARGGSHDP